MEWYAMAESSGDRRRDEERLDPAADAGREEAEQRELDEVASQTDEAQGFQLHQPTADELDDDDGYVEAEHGRHLEQEPSEADVEARERELDRRQIESEDH